MYFCPTCSSPFKEEDKLVKHMSKCWRENNPNHKPKPAPQSADINTREVNEDIASFFSMFQK